MRHDGTSENRPLMGHRAVVTGGNSGIGRAMARALLSAGAEVCIWGRDRKKSQETTEELSSFGSVHAITCHIEREDEVTAAFASSCELLGHVDSCFANAGLGVISEGPLAETSASDWRRSVDVNLHGTFFTVRAAARHMAARGSGSIVLTSSIAATQSRPFGTAYATSKGALLSMTRSLATEVGRHGVRVNTIVPGLIETPMSQARLKDERVAEALVQRIPLRRWGLADEVASLAVFLASDESSYITGASIPVDGGFSIT